jgi:hypothetical protein
LSAFNVTTPFVFVIDQHKLERLSKTSNFVSIPRNILSVALMF